MEIDQTVSATQGETSSTGSNYVTFAKVNVRSNSLAATLFYSGTGCVALGALGLFALLVLFLRNRRHRGYEEQNEVLGQIQEAEIRNRMAAANYQRTAASFREEPQPSPPPRANAPLVPMAADLYTDEFTLPEQPSQVQEVPRAMQNPPAAATEPASLPESGVTTRQTSQAKQKAAFDTEEILKEFLPRD